MAARSVSTTDSNRVELDASEGGRSVIRPQFCIHYSQMGEKMPSSAPTRSINVYIILTPAPNSLQTVADRKGPQAPPSVDPIRHSPASPWEDVSMNLGFDHPRAAIVAI